MLLRRLLVRHLLRRLCSARRRDHLGLRVGHRVQPKRERKQRRAQSGEAKKKTRVISQWENVNCDGVFSTGCTNCLEGSPAPTGPCQQSNGLCWALDGGVCPTGTTRC